MRRRYHTVCYNALFFIGLVEVGHKRHMRGII